MIVSAPVSSSRQSEVRGGNRPRQDYDALADTLGATIIAPVKQGSKGFRWTRYFAAAWAGFKSRKRYDTFISDIEHVGLLLAILLKLVGARNRHIMVCHGKVARRLPIILIRVLGLRSHIHHFIFYGPAVAISVRGSLGLEPGDYSVMKHAVDHKFWSPRPWKGERLIVGAGMLSRDWDTLIEAVRGEDVELVIAAFSPWVSRNRPGVVSEPAGNVRFTRCSPVELRALYERAMFVAVPLLPSRAQAGSLVIYEAIAMGRPVVATGTEGQRHMELVRPGETGFLQEPFDISGWKSTVRRLAGDPALVIEMGHRARLLAEAEFNLDNFTASLAKIVTAVQTSSAK